MLMLGPLFSLGLRLRACGGTRLPSRRLGLPPWIRVEVASVLVRVLVVLVWLAVSLLLVLPFPTSFQLALAGVVAVAFASTFARAFARILSLQLRRQALLVVALILVVLPLPTEGTGNGTPGKRRPPRAPSCRPHSAQRQLARAGAVGLLTGPHARNPRTHSHRVLGPGCTPDRTRGRRWESARPRTPHTQARGAPPGHLHAAPTARKATSQERALWGW